MFFKSIRFKILLWYILLLTITLLAFSSVVCGSFNKILYNDLDDLLSSRAEGIANSINAYWSAREAAGRPAGEGDGFIAVAADWIESKRKDPDLMSISVRILDQKGGRLVASKNSPQLADLPRDVLDDLLEGEESFDAIKGTTVDGKRASFRAYTRPVLKDGKVDYLVQVAGSTRLLTLATQNLAWVLFLLLPLTVFLAAAPALILVRMTLKPVDKMIDALKQTTAENLKLKIHLPDTKDEIKRLADTFNDMIERLDRSFSSQQSFIQDISCELKTPLESLKKEFDVSARTSLTPADYCVILRRGLEEIARFEKVIEELETLAKFDNNRMALEIRKVDLLRLLEDLWAGIRPRAEEKGVALSSLLKDALVIDGDERQIRALFTNLLDNAVTYTNRKGSISIAARKDHKNVIITIGDTGIGIEDSELPYIFDRFYQVNKSRVASGSFGLGLSIAKSVVEVHKGSIRVESKFGQGSTFIVTLPLSYPA